MSSIHLVHRYVVEQILSITTKCEFKNYGGTGRGLVDRIMGSFNIPETGWLQAVYTGNILNTAKLMDLIKNKLDEDQLEDVIDVWKELCNKGFSESSIMGHARNFAAEIRSRGFGKKPFFELDVDEWTVVLRTVNNTIKSARGYFEKAFSSTTVEEFNVYQQKLLRTLVTYPYIQETFIEDSFSQQLRHHLQAMSDPVVRTEHLITKLKEENDFLFKEVKVKQSKEGTEIMLDQMHKQHPHAKPYIHFLGTDHHIGHSFHFNADASRFAQECNYIRSLMLDLPKDGKIPLCAIKSIIHRSAHQKRLCQELFIDQTDWENFDKMDPQKRGLKLDVIFNAVMTHESLSADNADQSLSLPDYPNLAEEEVPVEDSRYLAIIKELYPDVYAEIKESGDSSDEGVNAILLKKITKANQQRKAEDRINLIEQLSDKLTDQFKVLLTTATPFDPSGECKNPDYRIHSKGSEIIDLLRQHQNPIDHFIGIDLGGLETRPKQGFQVKSRQPQHALAFLIQTPPEHTASEIETTSNVVINQKFIIHDVNGDFFSEYKMTWTDGVARIMLSHDKPGNGVGRQFRHLENLSGKMTQDEAFSRFQSLRRVSLKDPINPRPNPFGGPVGDNNQQQPVPSTEPAIGTEMVSRVIIIDNNRHELMFNTVTKRLTIFGAGKQIYSGIVKNEYQAAYVWNRYKDGAVIGFGIHAINGAIASLNGL